MFRRACRLLPLLAAAVILSVFGFASLSSANNQGQERDGANNAQTCDKSCHDRRFSAWDEQWLMMSIEGDLFEIQGGKLAQEKGRLQAVKDLGATLVRDHSKSLQDATKLAEKLGIAVPHEPSPSQQWELRVVAQFSGREFDRWYSDLEVQDHKQDITEAQDEVDKGCNDEVRRDAKDEIPTLREHLKLAQAALDSAR
ncbi:MAG: putative outer membrane protein [Solirubrobacterales bacterium]|nr:putative outer membrane protein [Solirubrobacterales bacterium]